MSDNQFHGQFYREKTSMTDSKRVDRWIEVEMTRQSGRQFS